ncbi:hypothetical protein BOTBODRAFT_428969 [Botryobasidium botryosum FD-172 SS1]|uniref:CUB domain-containing protein n=1 Tax=Botryobasidium botryosum (strain FD-172 SS1) TaxID=930990 RepID=A0A067M8W9_BOTB1|nr:hypothetical protein BOTBODRAFT_428969 [Botryobasidium botryosum FD-172 SS1]
MMVLIRTPPAWYLLLMIRLYPLRSFSLPRADTRNAAAGLTDGGILSPATQNSIGERGVVQELIRRSITTTRDPQRPISSIINQAPLDTRSRLVWLSLRRQCQLDIWTFKNRTPYFSNTRCDWRFELENTAPVFAVYIIQATGMWFFSKLWVAFWQGV